MFMHDTLAYPQNVSARLALLAKQAQRFRQGNYWGLHEGSRVGAFLSAVGHNWQHAQRARME
jgi:hypothetical protein